MKIKKHMALAAVLLLMAASGAPADTGLKIKSAKKAKAHAAAQTILLAVTDEGFVPANIKVKKSHAYNLVVTRKTDQTCAKQIVIPGYGAEKDLPLNVPVTIALVPKAAGEIGYSCGMGMLHGVLTVE